MPRRGAARGTVAEAQTPSAHLRVLDRLEHRRAVLVLCHAEQEARRACTRREGGRR